MMKLLVTCPRGCGQFLKQEIQRLGYTAIETQTTFVRVEWDDAAIARINLWSRIANKVYIELNHGPCIDFDTYFDFVGEADWKKYISTGEKIVVKAVSHKHVLTSTPTLQSLALKSIIKTLVDDAHWVVYDNKPEREVRIVASEWSVSVLLDTSGDPLWKRGYRKEVGDAPIKENVAVALLLSLGWRWKEALLDPFCGSGTFLIEAAMLAQNRAPGMLREFGFETMESYDKVHIETARKEAEEKLFTDKKYTLVGTDIDPEMVEIAAENAARAGVSDTISFDVKNILWYDAREGAIIANPPYGERLDARREMYIHLIKILRGEKARGGFITGRLEVADIILKKSEWKRKQRYNGTIDCDFWKMK